MNLQKNIGKVLDSTKKWDQELFEFAKDFLLSFDGITNADVELHLTSEYEKPNDLKKIYKQFCWAAQNRQSAVNVISGSIKGESIDSLAEVLFDFSPKNVAEKYSKASAEELLDEIEKKIKPSGKIRKEKRSLWPQYCRSVIHAAHFLKSFETAKKFYAWADFFANNSMAKPALPLMISIEVSGFGFPLACDFLKEIGYKEYGKPDVHLKDIFEELELIDKNEKSNLKQNYEILKIIDRIALSNDTTAYAVDKVFWLIGSGNFYRLKKEFVGQKEKFILAVKKKIGTFK